MDGQAQKIMERALVEMLLARVDKLSADLGQMRDQLKELGQLLGASPPCVDGSSLKSEVVQKEEVYVPPAPQAGNPFAAGRAAVAGKRLLGKVKLGLRDTLRGGAREASLERDISGKIRR